MDKPAELDGEDIDYLLAVAWWRALVRPNQLGRALRLQSNDLVIVSHRDDGSIWVEATTEGISLRNPLAVQKWGRNMTLKTYFKLREDWHDKRHQLTEGDSSATD